jgi:hypothetical protein
MGIIIEPKGVDFVIESPPLTDEERSAISAFIRESKAGMRPTQHSAQAPRKKRAQAATKKKSAEGSAE